MNTDKAAAAPIAGGCHAFFCGHIDAVPAAITQEKLEKDGWREETISRKDLDILYGIYYKGFIDSLITGGEQGAADKNPERPRHMILEEGIACHIENDSFTGGTYSFELCRLHLFVFPYSITLFSIETETSLQSLCMNDITLAGCLLRNASRYDSLENASPEYIAGLQALLKLCKPCEESGGNPYAGLLCTGNKLKIFQIIKSDDLSDELLFELGTLSQTGCVADSNNAFSPSEAYFKETVRQYHISIFNNWTALSLMDTFTIAMKPDCRTDGIWKSHYFRLIYIHAFYQKTLLFVLNRRFRSSEGKENMKRLVLEMKRQESHYAFSDISYNFLPQTLYKAMDEGMNIGAEREKLHSILEQEAQRQEELATARLTRVLTFLTVLTSLSVLYDTSVMLRELIARPEVAVYRIIVAVCMLAIIAGVFLVRFRDPDRKKKDKR